MKRSILCLILAMTMLLLAACGAAKPAPAQENPAPAPAPVAEPAAEATEDTAPTFEKMNLKFAHTTADSHIFNIAVQQMAENVKERTGGAVIIDIFPNGELGDATQMIEQCSLGSVDFTFASVSGMATYMPKLNALSAPFLFENYAQADKVIDAFINDWINAEAPATMNATSLGVLDYGFRQVTTNGIEVNTPEDLKGVKLRVPPSAGLQAAFNALGCNTQTIAYSELYTSLKQGVVDGEENPVGTILADCYYECQDQLAITNHFFDCQSLIINQDLWNSFSPELKEIIIDEVNKVVQTVRDYVSTSEADTIAELEAHGMNVTYPDQALFKAVMGPAYDEMAALSGQEAMDELLAAIEEFGA